MISSAREARQAAEKTRPTRIDRKTVDGKLGEGEILEVEEGPEEIVVKATGYEEDEKRKSSPGKLQGMHA